MLRRLLPYVVISILCIGATCERPVDLEINKPSPRLVINSRFTLGENVKVSIGKSQGVLDNTPPEYLADASVALYQEGQFVEQLGLIIDPTSARIPPYYQTANFQPLAGVTYAIRAEVAGFETVEAHSFIPDPVAFSYLQVSGLNEHAASEVYRKRYIYDVMLNFEDPSHVDNYYHLNLFQEVLNYTINNNGDTLIDHRLLQRVNLDKNVYGAVDDVILGGLLLKNKPNKDILTFNVMIEIVPALQQLGQLYAELRTVSREYYLYHTTFSRQQNQTDGPFNDPAVVFNNVNNGHGYFGGYNTTQDSVGLGF